MRPRISHTTTADGARPARREERRIPDGYASDEQRRESGAWDVQSNAKGISAMDHLAWIHRWGRVQPAG